MVHPPRSHRPWHAVVCLFLAFIIPVLGNRSAVACLNALGDDKDDLSAPVSQLESRDRKPKPTRQQMRVNVDRVASARTADHRPGRRGSEALLCPTSLTPPVRGQRAIAMARDTVAVPCYMRLHEVIHSNLAPPG